MRGITTRIDAQDEPEITITVVTREGKRFEFGTQKQGSIFAPFYVWRQNRNIKRYYTERLKEISDPVEREEFLTQVNMLKKQLTEKT